MKTYKILTVLLMVLSVQLFSQAPQLFNYQAVVRGPNGNILPDRLISVRISILEGTALGSAVYVETHQTATNTYGLINLKIGTGTIDNGTFTDIAWHNNTYFLKLEIDINAGNNYIFMGTTQLLSVPYALFAQEAESVRNQQTITKVDSIVTLSHNGGSFIDSDNQTLSLQGNKLLISGGNSVLIDADTTNELQTITKVDSIVTLSHNGGSFIDSDNQILSLQGTELYISGGNSVTIGGTVDLDWDPTNELQDLVLSNDTLYISMGNYVYLPYDRDSTNELQTLSKTGNIISLSHNGGSVTDSDNQNLSSNTSGTNRTINITGGTGITIDVADNDNDPTNELQYLSYSNDTLALTQGNFVVLPISQIVPSGTCIYSQSIIPPLNFSYAGEHYISNNIWISKSNLAGITGSGTNLKSVTINNGLYAVGHSGTILKIYKYNTQTDTWSFVTNAPTYRSAFQVAVINNDIYIMGGSLNSGTTSLVEQYDIISNTWTTKAPMQTARMAFGSAVVNNKIYVMGGSSGTSTQYATVEEYNPTTNTWSNKALMGATRVNFDATVVNDLIYVIGGRSGTVITDIVRAYNPITNTWVTKSSFPSATENLSISSIGNRIYILGGQDLYGHSDNMYEYNTLTETWILKSSMLSEKIQHTSSVINNVIYVLHNSGGGVPTTNEVYLAPVAYYMHCKN